MDAKIINSSIFELQLCCSKDCDTKFMVKTAEDQEGGKWSLKDLGSRTFVQCEENPDCVHVILSSVVMDYDRFWDYEPL